MLLVISMPESYLSIGKLLATAMDEYLALRIPSGTGSGMQTGATQMVSQAVLELRS